MHDAAPIIVFSLTLLSYGVISELLERIGITGPMVSVSIGIAVGGFGLHILEGSPSSELMQILGQITLVIILFTDAARINPRELFQYQTIPIRLLLIGMPLSMFFGYYFANELFPILDFWPCMLLAALLTPTDAALGEATVSNPKVPLYMRQSLNAESGLNDGLMLPIILAFAELANLTAHLGAADDAFELAEWSEFLSNQLILGPVAGVLVGLTGSQIIGFACRYHFMAPTYQRLAAPALAILAFVCAEAVHGNGFIAAFMAGLFFISTNNEVMENIQSFGKAEGEQLSLLTFLLFGAFVLPRYLVYLDWASIAYALLSLFVVRMASVWIALQFSGLDWRDKIFAGWFGPRGIASFLFLLIILEDMDFPGSQRVAEVVSLTVLFSIFLHGLSSAPLSAWFAWWNGPPDRAPGRDPKIRKQGHVWDD